ncbi:MAG: class E sortase [Coriobacteriia bacterium]|nr:class E sortase [Coriobacteriia bacterium]
MSGSVLAASVPVGPLRLSLHALANVLLGAALGLVAYVGVTDAVNYLDQSALRTQLVASVLGNSVVSPAQPVLMDFSGWDAADGGYWGSLARGGAFGRLVIEKMGLDTVVVKGTAAGDLRRGPGWITTTDLPGATGNVGISGHRTTYGHPFGSLDVLTSGDTIDLYSPYRRYRYQVVRIFAVTPDHVEVVAHTEDPMLTLTACHPPYSARERLIVQARLVDVRRLEGSGESAK